MELLRGIALILLAILLPSPLASAEQQEPSATTHFTFAVPYWESKISLGVFDETGELVRMLSVMAPESSFQIGLNGLIARWDGKDDEGHEVAPGEYEVRGFASGSFQTEGLAYSGNDWLARFGQEFPAVAVMGIATGPQGSLLVLAQTADGGAVLGAIDASTSKLLWATAIEPVDAHTKLRIAPAAEQWLVISKNRVAELRSPQTGALVARATLPVIPDSLDVIGDELVVSHGNESTRFHLLGFIESPAPETPRPPGRLRHFPVEATPDSPGTTEAVLDKAGRIWRHGPTGWAVFPYEGDPEFGAITTPREGAFWALARERGGRVFRVGQFSTDGEFLRKIEPATFLGQPEDVVCAGEGGIFVLTRVGGAGSEVVGIRPGTTPDSPPWEIFFRQVIDAQSLPVPEGFRELPLTMRLEVAGVLQPGREEAEFRLAVAPPDRIVLLTSDGLPVADLLQVDAIHSAAVDGSPESGNALRFWIVGNGRAEEYLVSGLGRMAHLDIGPVQWPPEPPIPHELD